MDRIIESKSISDKVIDLSNKIAKEIVDKCQSSQVKMSEQTSLLFYEGTFKYNVNSFLKGGNILTVNYIMYLAKTKDIYEIIVNRLNSEADPDTNTIRIVSGFINKNPAYDFVETISHELEHLYQYGRGMEKRESLYDKVKEFISLGRKNIDAYYVGLCCYYSFKHEQDAFAHQFYTRNMKDGYKKRFDDLIDSFDPYINMCNAYDVLINYQDNTNIMRAINDVGFSRKSFINLVYYRLDRFEAKLRNAYQRIISDNGFKNKNENIDRLIDRTNRMICECSKYPYDIDWTYESIYDF